MIAEALVLLFVVWVLVEAAVLDPIRIPVESRLSGQLAYFATCRVCVGFWVSLAGFCIQAGVWPWQFTEWDRLAAVNGIHLVAVSGHTLLDLIISELRHRESGRLIDQLASLTSAGVKDAVTDWAFENPADVGGVESFLGAMLSAFPTATIEDLHAELSKDDER